MTTTETTTAPTEKQINDMTLVVVIVLFILLVVMCWAMKLPAIGYFYTVSIMILSSITDWAISIVQKETIAWRLFLAKIALYGYAGATIIMLIDFFFW
ncbi:MAG: hypothetical protein WCI79_01955 [Candidatus Saccharibacteria bacterium]